MTGAQLSPASLLFLTLPSVLLRWLPGLVFAFVLLIVLRRFSNPFITPLAVLFACALFYLILWAGGWSVTEAQAGNWLLGAMASGALWTPLTPAYLAEVHWDAIFGQLDKIATVPIISLTALLLNVGGIELAVQRDMDASRELIVGGIGNLIAGLGGASPGYQSSSLSVLGARLGGQSRLIGISASLVVAAVLLLGGGFLTFIPRPVLGGLLLFLGLSFLVEWVYDAFFTLSRAEYALVLIILIVVGTFGFLDGVIVGLVAAVLLFVFNYSRIQVVEHVLTGETYRSTVDRPPAQRAILRAEGNETLILQLQEYIFFGTAQNVLDRIRARIEDSQLTPLKFVVLDFRRVSGLDSSAVNSFIRIQQLTHAKQIELLLTQVSTGIQSQLKRKGIISGETPLFHIFPTMDHGVEWCENQMLGQAIAVPHESESLAEQLAAVLPDASAIARLLSYLERLTMPAGTVVMRQGEAADGLYFVESGGVTVERELPDGNKMRLRTIHSGSVVGEVAMYRGGTRTASVITLEPSVLYRFTD